MPFSMTHHGADFHEIRAGWPTILNNSNTECSENLTHSLATDIRSQTKMDVVSTLGTLFFFCFKNNA